MLFDLPKDNNKNSKISTLKFRLFLALLTSALEQFPQAIGATISTNVLKEGETWKYLDCKFNTIRPNAEPGESPYTGILKIAAVIEGISKQTLSWLYDNIGKEFLVVWERCSDGQKFLGGSPCSNGMTLKLVSVGGQEGAMEGISLSFEAMECERPFVFYDAELVRDTPDIVSLAAGTTFAISEKSQYTMTDNAGAKTLTDITGVTDSDVGRIIELVGAGVNHPTLIEASDVFILNSGLSFSAAVGNSISLYVTKTDDGYAFYEVFRR